MVTKVDYEARRRAILTATINAYIKEAAPVSSDNIAEEFGLSPATIRNIFVELEQAGYLMHPYTSGGRIPTDKGYRYYVDFLLSQMDVLDDEKQRVIDEYRRAIRRLDDLLEKTSEMVSMITHYAGIVSFIEWDDKFFYRGLSRILDQPEFRNFERMRLVINALEDKKRMLDLMNRDFSERVKVYIGKELAIPEMENCSMVVSSYRFGNKTSGRIAVLGPARMEYQHIIPLVGYISDMMSEVLEEI